MTRPVITVATNNYDHLAPLACGDIDAQEITLRLDRFSPLTPARDDASVQACEQSLSQYLLFHAAGDRRFVGIPLFFMRTFRHRSFYVRRDSGLSDFRALVGRRVGTNGWPDTGNTWSRAALRASGVSIDGIEWFIGPMDDPSYDSHGHRPNIALPQYASPIHQGQTLRHMLLDGEIDAVMCPSPPKGFGTSDSPIVRLYSDYARVERDYATHLGFCPAHHVLAIRREVFEEFPWIARALYHAFDQSKVAWYRARAVLNDTQPWLGDDLKAVTALFGGDWQPHGLTPNRGMLGALCAEQYAQGLTTELIDGPGAFDEFARLLET